VDKMQAEQRYNTPGSLEMTVAKTGHANIHRHNFRMLESKIQDRDGVFVTDLESARGKRIAVKSIARIAYNDNGRVVYPYVDGVGLKSISVEVDYLEDEEGRFYASINTRRTGVDHRLVWHGEEDFGTTQGEQVLLESMQLFLDSLANGEYRR
jgi:hypothetical protein